MNAPYVDDCMTTDVRRVCALSIDIGLLALSAHLLQRASLCFAHPDTWYLVVISLAIINLIVMPAMVGASVGKWLTRLRIVDQRTNPPGMRAAIRRSLVPGTIWFALLIISPQVQNQGAPSEIEGLLWIALVVSMLVLFTDTMSWLSDDTQRAARFSGRHRCGYLRSSG